MKIFIANDRAGVDLKNHIMDFLKKNGYEVINLGSNDNSPVDYPELAFLLGENIVKSNDYLGIAICGTGIGISIAANKIKGVRAAKCNNTTEARLAKDHNNANILALGARMVGLDLSIEIVKEFLNNSFSKEERHIRRVDQIDNK